MLDFKFTLNVTDGYSSEVNMISYICNILADITPLIFDFAQN